MEKFCNECRVIKPIDEFYTRGQANGRSAYCKCCVKERNKKIRENNPDKVAAYNKEYQKENRQKISAQISNYYQQNKTQINAWKREWLKERAKTNPLLNLQASLRFSVRRALRGFKKGETTEKILGCTFDEARAHIESQFTEGMTWESYGLHGWHIDHKIPLASAKTIEEAKALCHYSNLQPLWAIDNLKKGAKYNGEQVES